MMLYHYTSRRAYEMIEKSGVVLHAPGFLERFVAKLAAGELDKLLSFNSTYGAGLYLTDLDPQKCNVTIMRHCWQNVRKFEKVEYYIKYDVPDGVLNSAEIMSI